MRALRGVDLEIEPGELTLLVGPSGCGKTTLISILAGTLEPTSGDVSVLGMARSGCRNDRRPCSGRRTSALYFSNSTCCRPLTAAENVAVPVIINGIARSTGIAHASETFSPLVSRTESNRYPYSFPVVNTAGPSPAPCSQAASTAV